MNDREEKIIKILLSTMHLTETVENLCLDTELENIGLDSIDFVKLIVEIEDEFCIEVPDDKLVITEVKTIRDLCNIVAACKDRI